MSSRRRPVEVHADWVGLKAPARMGVLTATEVRGKEVFSFEYDSEWLKREVSHELDPGLRLYGGLQYPKDGRDTFGVFLDSSPDRWGRVLMQRREALLARNEGRKARPLLELDYLLGVYDGHRMGGLRFKVGDGPYLDDNTALASPPWTSLRELEQASLRLEKAGAEKDPSYGKWLQLLIAPGRSLGGARPKASVVDPKGALWIAKFPSAGDAEDVGAWEGVLHALAEKAGVSTARWQCKRLGSKHHTFLSRRFDRHAQQRIHFASAMTLVDRTDGEDGASYLELAEVLIRAGAHPERDLAQLWRRILFNVCVSNADDHLRNHGFLLTDGGWVLAPAYDLNPISTAEGGVLNISETDNAPSLELVLEVAETFRVRPPDAKTVVREVTRSVKGWRRVASAAGISRGDQDRMANAFRVADEAG